MTKLVHGSEVDDEEDDTCDNMYAHELMAVRILEQEIMQLSRLDLHYDSYKALIEMTLGLVDV